MKMVIVEELVSCNFCFGHINGHFYRNRRCDFSSYVISYLQILMIEDPAAELEQLNVWRVHLDKVFNSIASRIHKHLDVKVRNTAS